MCLTGCERIITEYREHNITETEALSEQEEVDVNEQDVFAKGYNLPIIQSDMDQAEKETEAEVTPAVIIPETTPAPAETEATKQPETEVAEPEQKAMPQISNLLILGAGAVVFALLYYFKIYKPSHEEEEEDEGIETGDGFPTERDD